VKQRRHHNSVDGSDEISEIWSDRKEEVYGVDGYLHNLVYGVMDMESLPCAVRAESKRPAKNRQNTTQRGKAVL